MRRVSLTVLLIGLIGWCLLINPALVSAQDPLEGEPTPNADEETTAPEQVDVVPLAEDEEIDARLTGILEATDWFVAPSVVVQDGVVFLDGQTYTDEHRTWAGNLARNTQDVVAVVNRIEVILQPAWDFSPAWAEVQTLGRRAVQAIPIIIFGAVVLALAWWLMKPIEWLARHLIRRQLKSPLLINIVARTLAIPVFLLGLYLVLQVAGLTRLALTLLGGTGIVGIVIGFAFRDIAENFLASILLSVRKPFQRDDLIEVAGFTGIVQQMNTRSTVLMTLDGNHVQIPNASVFKNIIVNYTANPNRRSDFIVGIGYDDNILQAQALIADLLDNHPAVLQTPEPLVLVDALGAATVNLQVYFWYDATRYAPFKIQSSLIRLTKRVLQDEGISMPDESREVIFPQGVPIIQTQQPSQAIPGQDGKLLPVDEHPSHDKATPEPVTTEAEGDLRSEDHELREQASRSRTPEEGENLLEQE